jgi:hypothetical protein
MEIISQGDFFFGQGAPDRFIEACKGNRYKLPDPEVAADHLIPYTFN